jgi:hypothetical protein
MTFVIDTRRSQFHDWQVYGEFASEQAFRNELPNIRAQGLYTRRRPTTNNTEKQK